MGLEQSERGLRRWTREELARVMGGRSSRSLNVPFQDFDFPPEDVRNHGRWVLAVGLVVTREAEVMIQVRRRGGSYQSKSSGRGRTWSDSG